MRKIRLVSAALVLSGLISGYFGSVRAQSLQQYYIEGMEKYSSSDFRGAIDIWAKGLGIADQVEDRRAAEYFLMGIGDARRILGDPKGALTSYERAYRIAREIRDKEGMACALGNIGNVLSSSGDNARAISAYEQCLEIYREIGELSAVGTTIMNLGNLLLEWGDYPGAQSLYEETLEISEISSDTSLYSRVLFNMALVLSDMGKPSAALDRYGEALLLFRTIDDRIGEVKTLNGLGVVRSVMGDHALALSYFEEALLVSKELDFHKGVTQAVGNIGDEYRTLGDVDSAISCFQWILESARKSRDLRGEMITLGNLGNLSLAQRDYVGSLSYFERSFDIAREIGARPVEAEAECCIGRIRLELGEPARALAIFTRRSDTEGLGRYFLHTGDYEAAWECFNSLLSSARETRFVEMELASHIGMGIAKEKSLDHSEAFTHYANAAQCIESNRENVRTSDLKHFLGGDARGFPRLAAYEGLARVSLAMGKLEDCFYYCEHTKSRHFLDIVSQRYGSMVRSIPADLSQHEKELEHGMVSLHNQRQITLEKGNQDRILEIEAELDSLQERQREFVSSLRQTHPEYASLKYPEPIGVDQIALRADEQLLEYEVTDRKTIALLVESGKVVKAVSIPVSRDSLVSLVKRYRGFTDVDAHGRLYRSDLREFDPQLGARLYEMLIGGLASELDSEKKLIIVPDEILAILPFEMLVEEVPTNTEWIQDNDTIGSYPRGLKYFGDDHQISYYQSATALTTIRSLKKEVADKPLLALADPIFDSTDTRLTGKKLEGPKTEYAGLVSCGVREEWKKNTGVEFRRLAQSGEVAETLRESYGPDTKLLVGSEASEEQLLQAKPEEYAYLLFATHGILDNTVPYIQEPALVLTQVDYKEEEGLISSILSSIWQLIRSILVGLGLMDEAPEEPADYEDPSPGFLTLSEVMNMRIASDVVALTACNTGLGRNLTGEGVMGLGRAFQYAGARAVLMSLWSVEEQSTNILTENFFGYLKEGKNKLEALRLARRDVRQAGYKHPYYWAPFILVGER